MKKIRRGIFETNSSSTHTLTICTEEEYKRYRDGEIGTLQYPSLVEGTLYEGKKFFTKDEARNIEIDYFERRGEEWDEEWVEQEIGYDFTFSGSEADYMEQYEEHFVTPSGDRMVVFGEYGWE